MRRALTIAQVVWWEVLRRKDVYVLLILMGAMLLALMCVNAFGVAGSARYVTELGLLMAWLFSMILAVTLGARQLPREEETGTVFPLLAKPVSRAELLAGKWLGVWTSASAATAAFYGLAAGVAGLRGAFPAWGSLGQAWLLHAAAIGVVVSLALLLSTRLSQGAAATLTFALVFGSAAVVPQIPWMLTGVTSGARWGCMLLAYYALPHLEVFDMRRRVVHEWGPAPWGSCGLVLAYGTCLTLLFLVAAWLAYRGKRFKRGGA